MRRRYLTGGRWLRAGSALVLILAGFAVFVAGTPAAVNAADVAVTINNFAFTPGTITVPVGTRVVWTNQQPVIAHTTTSDAGVWDSGTLPSGGSFMFTFTQPGTFTYHCNIHLSMHGTVIVLPPDPTATPVPQPVGHPTAPVATGASGVTVVPVSLPTPRVSQPLPGQPPILVQPNRR